MRQPVISLWPRRTLLASLVAAWVCVLGGAPVSIAEPNEDAASGAAVTGAQESGGATAAAAGQWIHVDPETGRVGAPQPGTAAGAAIAAEAALSTSHEGLVVKPAPGGGEMVDLQGRFRSTVRARVKPGGSVVTDCVPAGVPVQDK